MSDSFPKREDIKIVIGGLDNAGKTSALIALRKKYNFIEKVKNLKPTIKIDYNSFDFLNHWTINIWDMGGQQKYRNIYINNPIYFTETNYLYYLIDIQDELKIEDSIHYLQELMNIYRNLDYRNEVIICFNKYDPKYKDNEEYADRVNMIKTLILKHDNKTNYKFFTTSIYDISSLSRAISYSLNKLLKLETINAQLKTIVDTFNCNHAILYTDTGLIISDYYHEAMDIRDFEEKITNKINENLEFFQRLLDDKVTIDERLSFMDNNVEYVKKYDIRLSDGVYFFYLGFSMPISKINDIKPELEKVYAQIQSTFSQV